MTIRKERVVSSKVFHEAIARQDSATVSALISEEIRFRFLVIEISLKSGVVLKMN